MNIINNQKSNPVAPIRIQIAICVAALLSVILINYSDAAIGGTGASRGRVSRFGSIFVNNREFDISSAVITVDGLAASEADLKLGQVVFVRGLFDDEIPVGIADEVVFGDNVEGPVTSIDDEQLTVLGQTVLTDAETVFDLLSLPNDFDGLDVNDQVEVSGFITATGEVLATRIEEKARGGTHEVTGVVSNLSAGTFSIHELTVDFSGAVLSNFPTGIIVNGDTIEAKGSVLGANGELIASEIEFQDEIDGISGDLGEFEGLITEFNSASSFSVAGIQISTNSQTIFSGGGPGNLTANVSVDVVGEFDANGMLVAERVIIRGTRIEVAALVDSVDVASFIVFGISVAVDSITRLEDKSSVEMDPFTLSDLSAGDYVELRSFKNPPPGNPVHAERVEREDPESETKLQGFINSVSTQNFELHGATVEFTPETEFKDAADEEISAAEFFAVLTPGLFLKVEGVEIADTVIVATDIELKLDD